MNNPPTIMKEQNDKQRFYEVINQPCEIIHEPWDTCIQCQQATQKTGKAITVCDDHFIRLVGDLLDDEDWRAIKARRGTAFVERWLTWIYGVR